MRSVVLHFDLDRTSAMETYVIFGMVSRGGSAGYADF
jgi:hypothetical protein